MTAWCLGQLSQYVHISEALTAQFYDLLNENMLGVYRTETSLQILFIGKFNFFFDWKKLQRKSGIPISFYLCSLN